MHNNPAVSPPLAYQAPRSPSGDGRAQLDRGPQSERGRDAAGERTGLVSSITSHTPAFQTQTARAIAGDLVMIDPRTQRASKCRKSILNAARLVSKRLQGQRVRYRVAFQTLTYAKVEDWNPKHISAYMTHLRNWLERRGYPLIGVWKAELQKRGAMHYHLMLWLPRGVTPPKPDKQGWWKHGQTNCQWLRNGYGYVAKYIGKDEHDHFPKGARMFALLGLEALEKREIRWWNTPQYVREQWPVEHDPTRAKGGGWLSRLTGEILESGWRYSGRHWHEGTTLARFIKSDRVQIPRPDYVGLAKRDNEIRWHEAMAESLRYQGDRVTWQINLERKQREAME